MGERPSTRGAGSTSCDHRPWLSNSEHMYPPLLVVPRTCADGEPTDVHPETENNNAGGETGTNNPPLRAPADDDHSQSAEMTLETEAAACGTIGLAPTVPGDATLLPAVGQEFNTLVEGIQFYINYARISGFDVRHSSVKLDRDGVSYLRYLVCCRQGVRGGGHIPRRYEPSSTRDPRERRRRISNRVKCRARIGFRKRSNRKFFVSIFEEKHTHQLCSESSKVFLRINRRLDVAQQAFLANCVKSNIGASTGLRFCKEARGSYANIGATDVEFHNFKRDLQKYVEAGDGEMIIATFKAKQEVCSDFFFDHHLDEEDRLARLFWADPKGRRTFRCYDDNVSFDATYGTNRYSMVFVPFTGVDNHKRCITFGAGLLTKEDADSYTWLLDKFKSSMGKNPLCVATDQDLVMRIAMDRVFPETRHRYCMWHIMTKVNEKLGGSALGKDETFRKKLNDIVWNERIHPDVFDVECHQLMTEY
ncbi:PREDICTED: protein FAR1-RELATED SEQUENCE 5-like [Ipomoea nil]|uniref:protein FAR1-RELATED SEQUENCE 5-like n=1 Tax=Ipomoea nil TaxID=35883 RepID=UPI000900D728|nr:PREDICTED: protein FAR1-RELATED SEQUENCE 5-like [Ipomoea nil]